MGRIMKTFFLTCLMMGTAQMKHLIIETGKAGADYSRPGIDYSTDYHGSDYQLGVFKGLLKGKPFGKVFDLLKNEEFVKGILREILNMDKLFNNLDKIVPGIKGLQTDVVETYNIIKKHKLFGRFPEFVKGGIPNIKKILAIIASGKPPTDQDFINLGKSLTKKGGPYIKTVAAKYFKAPVLKKVENGIDVTFTQLRKLINVLRANRRRRMRNRRF